MPAASPVPASSGRPRAGRPEGRPSGGFRAARRAAPRRRRCERPAHRVQGVSLEEGLAGKGHQIATFLSRTRSQEDRPTQPRARDVDGDEEVDEVTPDTAVDQSLAVWEDRQIGDGLGEVGSDVGQSLKRRLKVLQVLHQICLSLVDELVGGVAELSELGECGGELRPLAVEHVERPRYPVQRFLDDVVPSGQRRGDAVEGVDRGDEVVTLSIEGADERVEPGQQVAEVGLPSRKGLVERVDDVTDLTQATRIDDDRQRRQGLFGGGVRRGVVERDDGARRELPGRLLAQRWVQCQMHRTQKAGLSHAGDGIGRHVDVGFDRDLDVGVPVLDRHLADAAHHDVVHENR